MSGLNNKKFFISVAILIGTCIGAGVLGIPYIAAQAGFLVTLGYIFALGGIILLINLYLGEISLRTRGDHQLVGYAKRYLGRRGKRVMEFSVIFGVYSAIVAYMLGVGESISFLIFGTAANSTLMGLLFGVFMAFLLWGGINSLKRFERIGVSIVLSLLVLIFILFFKKIDISNLLYTNFGNALLPFGVILFSLLAFHAIPEVRLVIHKNEKLMKRVLISGTLACVLFYILFAAVVVGFKGIETPEVATLALGSAFVFLGILTIFTSWLSIGNALEESYMFDEKMGRKNAWFLASVVPLAIFLLVRLFDFFSFTVILSIGGVVAGGLAAILILLMIKKAKKYGDRKPEYSVPVNWILIGFMILIFILGILREVYLSIK